MSLPTLLLEGSWLDLFARMAKNPQIFFGWIIASLVILFALSRFNNYMEIRSVNRAIVIARGFVGSLMWFVIVPIIIFLVINIMALIHGVPTFDISFLFKWIGLTFSSYWWLIKCAFGSEDISGQKEVYSINAVVRIIWIIIPISFIWLRTAQTRITKLLLIPILLAILVVTRHKKSEETFITKEFGVQNLQRVPLIGVLFEEETTEDGKPATKKGGLTPLQRKVLAGVLVVMMGTGFAVAMYWHKRVPGLLIIVIGLMGFFFVAPAPNGKKREHSQDHPIHANIDSLVLAMDSIYNIYGECVEVYELSLVIDAAYKAQHEEVSFPDTLCRRYSTYFYDWCHR